MPQDGQIKFAHVGISSFSSWPSKLIRMYASTEITLTLNSSTLTASVQVEIIEWPLIFEQSC